MKRFAFTVILLAGMAHAQSPAKRAFTLADWYRVDDRAAAGDVAGWEVGGIHSHRGARSREQAAVRGLDSGDRWRITDANLSVKHREQYAALVA